MAKHKRPHKPLAQKQPPLTHFLCLPLVTSTSKAQLEVSLAKFKDAVTSNRPPVEGTEEASKDAQSPGEMILPSIRPKAIRPVGALHCTLGVMSLKHDELKAAVELLNGLDVQGLLQGEPGGPVRSEGVKVAEHDGDGLASLQRPITLPVPQRSAGPLSVDLKGLESMHAPEKTSILYIAPSDASDRLYDFSLALQKTFNDNGLLVEDNRPLKLHATVVNTIYAKGRKQPQRTNVYSKQGQSSNAAGPDGDKINDNGSSGHGPKANAPLKIDATSILENYKDYVWAKNVMLDRVAICEMGAKKILDEQGNVRAEEYTEVASVALPT